jgi:cytochrome c biogenesis factor
VTFEGATPEGELQMNVKINPLIWFAWIGFAITLLGTALAAWPKKTVVAA